MKVITSQSFIDYSIVDEKKNMLAGAKSVILPVWTTGLKDDNGEDLCVLADGHHRYVAAVEMDIPVEFEESEHPEGLMGERLLDQAWMDSDYRYLDTGKLVF